MPIIPLIGTICIHHSHGVIRYLHGRDMKRNLIKSAFDGIGSANFSVFKISLDVLGLVLPLLNQDVSKHSFLSELTKSSQDIEAAVENSNLGHVEDTLAETQQ